MTESEGTYLETGKDGCDFPGDGKGALPARATGSGFGRNPVGASSEGCNDGPPDPLGGMGRGTRPKTQVAAGTSVMAAPPDPSGNGKASLGMAARRKEEIPNAGLDGDVKEDDGGGTANLHRRT